uniref:Aladin seven-bladed propeller domain-containing protein n=1 Tax=Timema monikensis TaxID=170555 RepID=A0A7R9EAJ7_9NEOP|nr:unnamed protein product [Timema monikensis]
MAEDLGKMIKKFKEGKMGYEISAPSYENGLYEALETAAEPDNVAASPVVGFIATHLLRVANIFTSIRYTLHPHLRPIAHAYSLTLVILYLYSSIRKHSRVSELSEGDEYYPAYELGDNLIAAVSETRNWVHSPVRCISWHPHCTKLALATLDDSVRIYACDTPTRIIKCKTQRSITCVAWRPLTALVMAVGCDKGVFVWSLDPTSMATRPTTNCATLLKRPHHTPVTGVTWSPQGDLLLTSSATDTTMYVWDVELEEFSPVRRVDGGGVTVVSWSPCSTKLFSATTGTTFRVWDTSQWTADRWNVISGRVQTACWSPCGSVVLFCTTTEPLIYSLFVTKLFSLSTPLYQEQPSELLQSALIAADLTLMHTEDGHTVGGLVVSMAWDNKGCRLAVLFRDSPLVAVFRSSVTPTGAHLAPWLVDAHYVNCFINGSSGEIPNVISFQRNFEEGSMLTIAWSSGRIQHCPFIYSPVDSVVECRRRPGMEHSRLMSDSSVNNSTFFNSFKSIDVLTDVMQECCEYATASVVILCLVHCHHIFQIKYYSNNAEANDKNKLWNNFIPDTTSKDACPALEATNN